MKPYEQLWEYWREHDEVAPPANPGARGVENLERRYGISLPADFREYLLHACPAAEWFETDSFNSWWEFGRIKNLPEEYQYDLKNPEVASEASAFIFFLDHAAWCWAWAIHCGEGPNRGRIACIDGGKDGFVADSFASFMTQYITDPYQLRL